MQRLGATVRWAPANRQLADALTKDAADPVNLLRSCMRSGKYQLSPEHVILERAAAIQAQATTGVLSIFVTPERAIRLINCFRGSICVMVVFPSLSSELQMRSFSESLKQRDLCKSEGARGGH